jgi:hypothetical protein
MLTCLAACSGCSRRDCLAPPSADATPPEVSLKVIYVSPDSRDPDTLHVTSADSAAYVEGRADQRLRVSYSARDPEGMKRLWLGAARLTTVGAGLDSRRIPVEPLLADCPVERLTGTWTAPTVDPGTRVTLSLSAQNWAGLQQATPTVTIRLR